MLNGFTKLLIGIHNDLKSPFDNSSYSKVTRSLTFIVT